MVVEEEVEAVVVVEEGMEVVVGEAVGAREEVVEVEMSSKGGISCQLQANSGSTLYYEQTRQSFLVDIALASVDLTR